MVTISVLVYFFVAWLQLSWWVHIQHWQVKQVNSLRRQRGQVLTANNSTSLFLPIYSLKAETRGIWVVPAAMFRWNTKIIFLIVLLSPHQGSKLLHFICQRSHTYMMIKKGNGLTLFQPFLHFVPALHPRRLLFNPIWSLIPGIAWLSSVSCSNRLTTSCLYGYAS